jgi:protein-S-isoprenylcysteine O-methyltransferase Ste14
MPREPDPGGLLVALQFGLLAALLAVAARGEPLSPMPVILVVAGTIVGLWAVACNRPGNFNIRPTPKAGGQLVSNGPYRWIRHPMYTALLLAGAGLAAASEGLPGWGLWIALAAVLAVKSTVEERRMIRAHPEYADYATRTRRFVPWLL